MGATLAAAGFYALSAANRKRRDPSAASHKKAVMRRAEALAYFPPPVPADPVPPDSAGRPQREKTRAGSSLFALRPKLSRTASWKSDE